MVVLVWKYQFAYHLLIDEHLNCVQLLAETTMNIYIQVFVWTYAFTFLSKYQGVEWLLLKVAVCLTV